MLTASAADAVRRRLAGMTRGGACAIARHSLPRAAAGFDGGAEGCARLGATIAIRTATTAATHRSMAGSR